MGGARGRKTPADGPPRAREIAERRPSLVPLLHLSRGRVGRGSALPGGSEGARSTAGRMGAFSATIHGSGGTRLGREADAGAPLVLVAEDEERSRSALCEVLREGGYRAAGAADGLELLHLATALRPAAVVLDLAMPRLNGMEAAAALRSDPGTRGVKILGVTASWLAERADLLAAAGFDGALRKPCAPDRVLEALRRLLEGGETADEREEGAGVSGAVPHPW